MLESAEEFLRRYDADAAAEIDYARRSMRKISSLIISPREKEVRRYTARWQASLFAAESHIIIRLVFYCDDATLLEIYYRLHARVSHFIFTER